MRSFSLKSRDYSFATPWAKETLYSADSFGTHGAFKEFISGFYMPSRGIKAGIRKENESWASWHSCDGSNLPQWPADCRKPVEACTSRSRARLAFSTDERACWDYVLSHTKPDTSDVGRRKCAVNLNWRGKGKMRLPWARWIFASA